MPPYTLRILSRKRSREQQECDSRIQGWLQSIENQIEFEPQPAVCEPPAKRARRMPSMPGASANSAPDEAGVPDEIPTDGPRRPLHLQLLPTKRKSTMRTDLEELEKPVLIMPRLLLPKDASEILPKDVRGLFRSLYDAINREQVVPYEVREDIAPMVGRVLPHYLSDPDPDAEHVANAKATFGRLREIMQAASEATEYQRYDCAWNSYVYEPLLKLVFSSNIMAATDVGSIEIQQPPKVRARWEPIMSATIAGDSIPYYQPSSANGSVHLACSITGVTDDDASSINSAISVSEVQSRKDSKKVDFTIVLDVVEDEPLQKTIVESVNHISVVTETLRHVNQTIYSPLKYSPIAVSIEAGLRSVRDRFIQLSVWTAAWHKRMYGLRWHLADEDSMSAAYHTSTSACDPSSNPNRRAYLEAILRL